MARMQKYYLLKYSLVYAILIIIQGLVKNVKDEKVKDEKVKDLEVWCAICYGFCNCLLRAVGRLFMHCGASSREAKLVLEARMPCQHRSFCQTEPIGLY